MGNQDSYPGSSRNTISGTVSGPMLQADTVRGPVSLHHHEHRCDTGTTHDRSASEGIPPRRNNIPWLLGGAAVGFGALGAWLVAMTAGRTDLGNRVEVIAFALAALFATTLICALLALRAFLGDRIGGTHVSLDRAADELARMVWARWHQEAVHRGLLRLTPLTVRWLKTRRPVIASPPLDHHRLPDDVPTIHDLWLRLPSRQLVVLGAPGAGKTSSAVLLVLRMLETRRPGDPVPVLLDLASWDPTEVEFETWFERRVVADHPKAVVERVRGSLRQMLRKGTVVPVLDGLDEMPRARQQAAIQVLTAVLGKDRPVVLTCRAQEYEDIVRVNRIPLARAAVVELVPVTVPDAIAYLIADDIDGERRWAAVHASLRACPGQALATALSTPLMVYLARIVHGRAADPAHLLQFRTAAAIEEHLLNSYIDAIYLPRLPRSTSDRYPSVDARRWLTAIATQMTRTGVRGFSLWATTLIDGVLPSKRMNRVAALLILSYCVAFGLNSMKRWPMFDFGGWVSLVVGVLNSIYAVVLLSILGSRLSISSKVGPFQIRPRLHLVRVLPGAVLGLVFGVLFDLVFFLPSALTSSGRLTATFAPQAVFVVVAGAITGAVLATLVDTMSDVDAADPIVALRRDRQAFLVIVSVPVAVAALWLPWLPKPRLLMVALTLGVLLSVFVGVGRAWCRWQIVSCRAALSGMLPWPSLPFLVDAHRRGVLRVVNGEYQFRHARLLDHLGRTPTGTGTPCDRLARG